MSGTPLTSESPFLAQQRRRQDLHAAQVTVARQLLKRVGFTEPEWAQLATLDQRLAHATHALTQASQVLARERRTAGHHQGGERRIPTDKALRRAATLAGHAQALASTGLLVEVRPPAGRNGVQQPGKPHRPGMPRFGGRQPTQTNPWFLAYQEAGKGKKLDFNKIDDFKRAVNKRSAELLAASAPTVAALAAKTDVRYYALLSESFSAGFGKGIDEIRKRNDEIFALAGKPWKQVRPVTSAKRKLISPAEIERALTLAVASLNKDHALSALREIQGEVNRVQRLMSKLGRNNRDDLSARVEKFFPSRNSRFLVKWIADAARLARRPQIDLPKGRLNALPSHDQAQALDDELALSQAIFANKLLSNLTVLDEARSTKTLVVSAQTIHNLRNEAADLSRTIKEKHRTQQRLRTSASEAIYFPTSGAHLRDRERDEKTEDTEPVFVANTELLKAARQLALLLGEQMAYDDETLRIRIVPLDDGPQPWRPERLMPGPNGQWAEMSRDDESKIHSARRALLEKENAAAEAVAQREARYAMMSPREAERFRRCDADDAATPSEEEKRSAAAEAAEVALLNQQIESTFLFYFEQVQQPEVMKARLAPAIDDLHQRLSKQVDRQFLESFFIKGFADGVEALAFRHRSMVGVWFRSELDPSADQLEKDTARKQRSFARWGVSPENINKVPQSAPAIRKSWEKVNRAISVTVTPSEPVMAPKDQLKRATSYVTTLAAIQLHQAELRAIQTDLAELFGEARSAFANRDIAAQAHALFGVPLHSLPALDQVEKIFDHASAAVGLESSTSLSNGERSLFGMGI